VLEGGRTGVESARVEARACLIFLAATGRLGVTNETINDVPQGDTRTGIAEVGIWPTTLNGSGVLQRLACSDDEPGVLVFRRCNHLRDHRCDVPVRARCCRAVPVQRQDAKVPDRSSTPRMMTGVTSAGRRTPSM
jgi:hypothetical protein